ncbi:MAG: DUF4046 domain-containing protein [Clostridia bacterium]|nr:DUF4046 domain-containing protein [Clostridia bacterium]
MKRYKKRDYSKLTTIDVYNLVCEGTLKVFPNNYLDKEKARKLVRHVILDKLHMSRKEICEQVNLPFLSKYKLGGVKNLFEGQAYNILSYSFSEMEIKPWELSKVHPDFWKSQDNQKMFMQWLVNKENIDTTNVEEIRKINAKLVYKYAGSKPLVFSGGLFNLIKLVTGDSIKEWELVKINKWDEQKAIEAVKWMIEEKLKWSDEEIYEKLQAKTFYENNLGGLLSKFCNHSPYTAINLAYPGKFERLKNGFCAKK